MIQSIRLQHFRSYTDESFEFGSSVNIIVGPNASGKTNLLEAILMLSYGSSYRAHDIDLIAFTESWARLDGYFDGTIRTVKLVREPKLTKTYELEGNSYHRLTAEHTIPVVLFEPTHLLLLTGSPDLRRDYLDNLLMQLKPGYGSDLRAYRRTLAQRNRLLKSPRLDMNQLFPWNIRLSELGGRLVRERLKVVADINEKILPLYRELAQSTIAVSLAYHLSAQPDQYESHMLQELERRSARDALRGFTSFGPHREDISVNFGDYNAADVASRGETRTLVLALKIIELRLLQDNRSTVPLLLLDDVFSELDGTRRRALTTHLKPYQTFITTTDADILVHHFVDSSNLILLAK